MRKHTAVRGTWSATMPIASAVLAATATVLLSGCTAPSTPPAAQSAATPSPTAPTPATTVTVSKPPAASPTSGTNSTNSTGPSSTPTAAAPPAPTCNGTQLSLSTSQDSAAGIFDYIVIEFVNHGPAPCAIQGYPGAAAYSVTSSTYVFDSSRQLTGHVADQYTAPTRITLAPTGTASTILEWIDKPTNGHPYENCLRYASGTFGITAPNTTQTTYIRLPSDVCSGILIHPLIPGATGRQTS